MRPSSSASDPGLFDEVLARGRVRCAVADPAWLQAMLDTERALAEVQASLGLIPVAHAEGIAGVADASLYDIAALGRSAAGPGNPVLPLVLAMRSLLPEEAGPSVHKGATSQDILDTASMLVAYRAMGPVLDDLSSAAQAAARLARTYRDVPMAGRTLLQQAEAVTMGLTAAIWLVALGEAADRLVEVRETRLAVQLGGPVGRLSAYQDEFAEKLGLAAPLVPWHTNRLRVADLAGALGAAAGVIGKVARDVTLLAQTEVGEVSEAHPGASSSMPHKQNPVAAISALACSAQAPGLVATILASMVQEHGRAAGAWHAEWRPVRELLISAGSAAAWLSECLGGLTVNEEAMAAHVALLPGLDLDGATVLFVDRALQAYEEQK
jgi:3-carboxy-cis,cis-muconate cycloisomerase